MPEHCGRSSWEFLAILAIFRNNYLTNCCWLKVQRVKPKPCNMTPIFLLNTSKDKTHNRIHRYPLPSISRLLITNLCSIYSIPCRPSSSMSGPLPVFILCLHERAQEDAEPRWDDSTLGVNTVSEYSKTFPKYLHGDQPLCCLFCFAFFYAQVSHFFVLLFQTIFSLLL